MRTGFDIEIRSGSAVARLYRTAAATTPRGRLVSQAFDGRHTCLLVGRLHYRDELLASLPVARRLTDTDAGLALAMFATHGPAGLTRLEGEFSLVVCDSARGQVFALRDPLGNWPLYWAVQGTRLLAGTSLLDLARRLGTARPNLDHLGAFLMYSFPGSELPREDTALDPFRRLPAGRLVRLDVAGGLTILHQHTWPVPAEEETGIDAASAGARFLELFRSAVRERVEPGATAAHLSGGMDSSSVVCLARDLLRQRGDDRPLHALSLVYQLPSLAGETPNIRLVLDQGGPVAPVFVDGDRHLAFDWFSAGVPEHDEPYAGLHQLAMERSLVHAAHQAGAATVLTGGGAEVVAEGSRDYLADLVRRGRWRMALDEARAWARTESTSLWSILSRHTLGPLVPSCLRDGVATLFRRGRARWPEVSESAIPPWVRPSFTQQHRLWRLGREAVRRRYHAPYEETACRFAAALEVGCWSTWHLAGPCGLHNGRPFLDPRLVRFALSLPGWLRRQPGTPKPLLRSAMTGILPESIRIRQWKGHFNDVYRLGLARHLGALEAMILHSSITELDLFDTHTLRTALHQVAAGIGRCAAGMRLNSTLALIAWYDQLGPALARPADEPSEVVRSGLAKESEGRGHVVHV